MTTSRVPDLFREHVRGAVIAPGDIDYDEARRIWNADIDRRPAAVVRAQDVEDVRAVVRIAAGEGLTLAVRGGGHSFAGHSTVDDGVVLDLRQLRGVSIDAERRVSTVQGGCLLGDLDRASQEHGLVTPAGVVSHTGVAGLTLGGGYGYLSRRLALSCDSLRAVDLVTADGSIRRVSDDTDPDLMWGIRGGGGNFGVVTDFEFDAHPQGLVLTGWLLYPFEDVLDFMEFYSRYVRTMPEDLCLPVRVLAPSSTPLLPPELQGGAENYIAVRVVWGGDLDEGRRAVDDFKRAWGRTPVVDSLEETQYVDLQRSIDVTSRHGLGRYAKAGYLKEMPRELVEGVVKRLAQTPSDLCEVIVFTLGGAVSRVDENATAYRSRDAMWMYEVRTAWTDPGQREEVVSWVRDTWGFMNDFAMDGVYINLVENEGEERIRKAYGAQTYDRLSQLKAKVDPGNLFRLNQNIPPAR